MIALRSQPYLALIAFVLALIIAAMELVRYGDDLLYAAGNGPNPLTLTCVMLLSLALMHKTLFPVQHIWRRVVFFVVFALSLFRLVEIYILQVTPLTDVVTFVYNRYSHADVVTSKGTSLSLMLFSLGALLRRRLQTWGFAVSLLGLVPVSFAFMIYSYGERNIEIEMSPATLLLLMLVGFSSVFTFARSTILRPFLTSSVWGWMARLQTLGTTIGIWIIGAVSHMSNTGMMFEVVLASAMWVFAIIILVSGSVFERIERDRRTLSREVEHRARHDPLTGLLNRHAVGDYVAMIHHMVHGRRRDEGQVTVGVILADIDLFKRVNDTLGHEAGDRVLQHVARVLRSKLRSSDVVARWGGEEFLMLLPGATLDQTMNTAQVLRTAVATHVSWKNGLESEPITISIGVSSYNQHDSADSLEQIIQHADTALYNAKSQGRNRVKCFKTSRKPQPKPSDFLPPRDQVH